LLFHLCEARFGESRHNLFPVALDHCHSSEPAEEPKLSVKAHKWPVEYINGGLKKMVIEQLLLRSSLALSFPHEKHGGKIYLLWPQTLIQHIIRANEECSSRC
jgi:hypothetical protein